MKCNVKVTIGLIASLMGFSVMAQEMQAHADALLGQYPASVINSTETADQALLDADKQVLYINARLIERERLCYDKFFTTSCLDTAREEHRQATKTIREVTVTANRFKRQQRADGSDRSTADNTGKN